MPADLAECARHEAIASEENLLAHDSSTLLGALACSPPGCGHMSIACTYRHCFAPVESARYVFAANQQQQIIAQSHCAVGL